MWSKVDADWGSPTEITEDGIYTLQPLVTTGEAYRILLGTDEKGEKDEYLLLENRQKLLFDIFMPGTGLAIYQVDDAAPGQRDKGYPGLLDENGIDFPENGNHYMVAMLQADGLYDLEQAKDYGDRGDLWTPGGVLGPGNGGTVHPNTDRYQNGEVVETGITITILEPENDLEVRFQVEGLRVRQGDDNSESSGQETDDVRTEAPTAVPTEQTTVPTMSPTNKQTAAPTKATPNPTTMSPTNKQTAAPTKATPNPTTSPTDLPILSSSLVPVTDPPTPVVDELTTSPTSDFS